MRFTGAEVALEEEALEMSAGLALGFLCMACFMLLSLYLLLQAHMLLYYSTMLILYYCSSVLITTELFHDLRDARLALPTAAGELLLLY